MAAAWPLRVILCAVLLLGDSVHFPARLANALADTSTHASVSALQWLLLTRHAPALREHAGPLFLAAAACMGSAIDVDHFLAARSLSLQDAVSLPTRPLLHATAALLALVAAVFVLFRRTRALQPWVWLPLMAATAILSHHLRDAHRRGLWLWPLPLSLPVPYPAYLLVELVLADGLALLAAPLKTAYPVPNTHQSQVI